MRYKVGDVARVRDDLKLHERYYMDDGYTSDSFVEDMERYSGQDVMIDRMEHGKYRLTTVDGRAIGCYWTDGMLGDVNSIDASDLDFEGVFG